MNNRATCHAWANDTRPSGKGSNIYFEESIIYSYGRHFPMARRLSAENFFFTTRGYSVTTSKHLSYARGAVPFGAVVFSVADVLADTPGAHKLNAEKLLATFKDSHAAALRARGAFEWKADQAAADAANFCEYTRLYVRGAAKLKRQRRELGALMGAGRLFPVELREKKRAVAAAAEKVASVRDAACREKWRLAEAEREAAAAGKLEAWKNGASVQVSTPYGAPVALRVVRWPAGAVVETSNGAEVPLAAGLMLFNAWRDMRGAVCLDQLLAWGAGEYQVAAITEDQITLGCTRISFEECARVLEGVSNV